MAERVSTSENFVNHYVSSYPRSVTYRAHYVGETITGTSNHNFRNSRKDLMEKLIVHGKPHHDVFSHSLLAEQVVNLALNPMFEGSGFAATLAPQSIEHGNGQKGVDLILTDSRNVAYLGIDVKMRKGSSYKNRDGYGWNEGLKAPFIILSLGNWEVDMHDREDAPVYDWLKEYTVPRIQSSGQIPRLEEFRQYLAGRIERNLHGYWENLTNPEIFPGTRGIPASPKDISILQKKLAIMHSLFTELATS